MSDTDFPGSKRNQVGVKKSALGKVRFEQRPREMREEASYRAEQCSMQRDNQC